MESHRSPAAEVRPDDTIATRFERQADATPDNLAIITDEISYTYRELDALAANVATHIVAAASRRERPIAVLMEKGPLPIAAMLGAVKAGQAEINARIFKGDRSSNVCLL
jgi:non-ribosomal peptide synthetase component F